MSTEQNKALARRNFELFDQGDFEGQMALFAPDIKIHLGPEPITLENFKQFLGPFATAFSNSYHVIETQIAEGDKVLTRWTWHGTHTGDFQGIPPTGNKIAMPGTTIDRIVEGKVAERWGVFDALGLMQQLGAIPAPEAA